MAVRFGISASLFAAAAAFSTPPLPPRAAAVARPRAATVIAGDIPDVVIGKTRLALATKREVGDEDEMRTLWKTFRKCFPNEKMAIEAAEKNTNVFNPQLNSPRKIKGTFALLKKRLGNKGAQELIMKNPGVLICSPESLSKESNESILQSAELIAVLDANKPLIRIIARTTGFLLIGLITYGIASKNAAPGADMSPAGVLQQLIDANPYFKKY